MTYEFYLDLYFLENLMMNYTVLRMLAALEQQRHRMRSILAAAAGSAVMCLGMITGIYKTRWLMALLCMAVECGMTAAVFEGSRQKKEYVREKGGRWKKFMYRAVIFRLLSLLAEGSWQILRDYFRVPFPYSMAAGILLPFLGLLYIRKKEQTEQFIYPVTLVLRGKEKKVTALWDSGNQLSQPVTGRPVHIVDLEVLHTLLTECELLELQKILELQTVAYPSGMFSLIPYQSIGKRHGVLPVLKLDEIRVEKEKETVDTSEVLAAVSRHAVSCRGDYQMILHP